MVAWTNLFALDPPGGALYGYGRYPATSFSASPWGSPNAVYYLSSPGAVDANVGERAQYAITIGADTGIPGLSWWGAFAFDAADVTAAAGRFMTANAYLAPASAFAPGVTPTITQIRDNSVVQSRLSRSRTTVGNLKTYGTVGLTSALTDPNIKYWLAIVPVFVVDMSVPPTAVSDTPMAPIEDIGRGISLWTNRTPTAPKILTPSAKITTFAGSTVNLTFAPQGPDRIASFPGDGGPNDLDDLAGVQIQYAPVATADNPTPEWSDLLINNADGSEGTGWYIDGTTEIPIPVGEDRTWLGAFSPWWIRDLEIRCGGQPTTDAYNAYLPSGNWQIRLRTFDYGHPFPNSTHANPWLGAYQIPALGDTTGQFNPDIYPESNTSPWSEPVIFAISEQVPKPLAISPVNSIAVIEDTAVTLVWQYRNTYYEGPWPQGHRLVQIQQAGDSTWTTLVDEDSSSSSLLVTGFDLVSGNAYEWRVQTTEDIEGTPGETSAFSDVARFWIVPEPESGSVIPDPGEMIEGATLGCGTHTVQIYRRGGTKHVGTIAGVSSVEWNRMRDDISAAEIEVSDWDIDCGNLLATLEPWAYEVVLFRDNGYGVERVWEGPISLLTYRNDRVVIQAKDVMNYSYRRIIKQAFVDSGDSPTAGATVVDRARRVLQNIFAPDDPNILGYLTLVTHEDDAKQYRSLPPYSRTGYEEVDDMASNAGLDYTAVGRRIILWGTKHRIGTLPEFTDANLGNAPIVSVYGMSGANVYAVSDGNGIYGEADRLDEDGKDNFYGLVEMLSSTWASDTAQESGTYTEAGLAEVRESFARSAEHSLDDRYPMPVVVRVPDNTRVNPDTVISIQHLVPGVIIPLRSTGTLRTVVDSQKLDSVKVVEKDGDEVITITMSPFNRDDTEVGEGE